MESAFHYPTPIRILIPGFFRLANSLLVRDKVHDNHRSAHQKGCRETMMHFALKFLVDDPLFEEEQPYGLFGAVLKPGAKAPPKLTSCSYHVQPGVAAQDVRDYNLVRVSTRKGSCL